MPDAVHPHPNLAAGTHPVNLTVVERPCLVVGAGPVAAGKAASLLEAGAVVTVVAPDIGEPVRRLKHRHLGLRLHQRPYRRGEAASYRLVVTATNDPVVNRQVYLDCEAAAVWCNSADDVENCSFILPAVVRRGPLVVTVSSTGRSPAVASWLRRRLEREFDRSYEELIELVADVRSDIRQHHGTSEAVDWATALDEVGDRLLDLLTNGRRADAAVTLAEALRPHPDPARVGTRPPLQEATR